MPKNEPLGKTKWWGVAILVIWAGAVIWCIVAMIIQSPLSSIGFALFAAAITTASLVTVRKLNQLRNARQGEDIGTFARSLAMRQLDTWVVRAVYEEISQYVGTKEHPFPVRANDRLTEDLQVDREDFGSVLCAIADRCGRSLDKLEENPLFPKFTTVADVIHMLMLQSKESTPEQSGGEVRS